ncbi:hypothetical protein [Ferrimonas marina]|uniref:Uncharacterized protein n=1 Tax=Ferrimonas marina TaxID=299255 RepID=A0A1M5TPI3_9GAMM|nr:hypothetical protein [Ferrimonas marina]SHH52614.1 hypothetical protein SAMN02745129_2227 [Ferrimonas marina]
MGKGLETVSAVVKPGDNRDLLFVGGAWHGQRHPVPAGECEAQVEEAGSEYHYHQEVFGRPDSGDAEDVMVYDFLAPWEARIMYEQICDGRGKGGQYASG